MAAAGSLAATGVQYNISGIVAKSDNGPTDLIAFPDRRCGRLENESLPVVLYIALALAMESVAIYLNKILFGMTGQYR
jgi:hypothetical protein